MFWCKAKLLLFLLLINSPILAEPLILQVPKFGSVTVYQPSHPPTGVVLFASGLEGWKGQVTEIAQALADENRLVAGFDLNAYLAEEKGKPFCPARDIEQLGKVVERQLKLPQFFFPALVGYAEGGTVVYITEAEAPTSFIGTLSIGFCPKLLTSDRVCPGWSFRTQLVTDAKSVTLLPAQDLRNPWIVLEGIAQPSCAAKEFVEKVPRGEFVETNQKDGVEQVKLAIDRFIQDSPTPAVGSGLSDLPLVELNGGGKSDELLILVSGDGGWVSLDREIGVYLQNLGVSVIGFDALRYFWTGRTPKEGAHDLSRILSYYLPAWKKKKAVIAGYSMGADVLPFFLNRLPQKSFDQIAGAAFIGPSAKADFQTGILDHEEPREEKQIFPALTRLAGLHMLCIGGLRERPPSLCKRLQEDEEMSKKIDIEFFHSNHMFELDPKPIGDMLIEKFHLR